MREDNQTNRKRERRLPYSDLRFRLVYLAIAYASGSLVGCGQVRLIRDAPDGGVVAIPNNTNQWPSYYRNRAEYLMKRKCPDGYVIVNEEEGVDNPATRDGRKPNEHFEYEGGYIRLTTYDRKEYRITFRSAATANNAPAPVVSPPRTPAEDESKDELPPPRPLPYEPRSIER
ncbi:MAG TPA: hypothetical protein VH592_22340 [Gemmataceae bacterium]|jgi:hypothetical protein